MTSKVDTTPPPHTERITKKYNGQTMLTIYLLCILSALGDKDSNILELFGGLGVIYFLIDSLKSIDSISDRNTKFKIIDKKRFMGKGKFLAATVFLNNPLQNDWLIINTCIQSRALINIQTHDANGQQHNLLGYFNFTSSRNFETYTFKVMCHKYQC